MADTWMSTDQAELGEYETTSVYDTYCFCGEFVAPSSYDCDRLGIYSFATPTTDLYAKLAIYADSGGAPSGTPLRESSPILIDGSSQWFDVDITSLSISNGVSYHAAMIMSKDPVTDWRWRNSTPANGGSHYNTPITYPTFPTSPSSGPSTRRYGAFRMGYSAVATYKMEGVTKDKDGDPLASCECYLYKLNVGETDATFIAHDQSDGSGNYSFTGIEDDDAKYFVVAWKDDTPHVFDCTDHVLVPIEE